MINTSGIGSAQNNWPVSGRRSISEDPKPSANAEIQKLTEDIEKEESEIKRIDQELSKHLADGAQDMAKLKSAEIAQKQMQIQSMQLQISKLENPEETGETTGSAAEYGVDSGRANYDRYIKSDGQPERTPGVYRLEKDENGDPKIVFDRPEWEKENAPAETAALAAQEPASDGAKPDEALPGTAAGEGGGKPEDDPEKKVEAGKSVGDDSRWKAEIDKLKQKQSQLSREISTVGDDENKRGKLEAQLAKVEAELAVKDTDAYRKQRAVVRYLGSQTMDAADAAKLD